MEDINAKTNSPDMEYSRPRLFRRTSMFEFFREKHLDNFLILSDF